MERASSYDLELATKQGTILSIHVDGVAYGKGQYSARRSIPSIPILKPLAVLFKLSALVLLAAFCMVFCIRLARALSRKGLLKRRRRVDPNIPYYTYDARPATKKKKKSLRPHGPIDLDEAMLDYEDRHMTSSKPSKQRDNRDRRVDNDRRGKGQPKNKSRKPGKLSLALSSDYSQF